MQYAVDATMNIFKVIRQATSKIERIHSEFLAESLRSSHHGDRELFRKFWQLAVDLDENWPVPTDVEIKTETVIEANQRVDITIFDLDSSRCLGIEVKTTEASTTDGQLEAYYCGLMSKDWGSEYRESERPVEVRMAYLTPFNRRHFPDQSVHSRREFCAFNRKHAESIHLSWIDVATIPLQHPGDLWAQHQEFVLEEMCIPRSIELRNFDTFFGDGPTREFWDELLAAGSGIKVGKNHLDEIIDIERLVKAFKILIESPCSNSDATKQNKIPGDLKERFGSHPVYGSIHNALFALADKYSGVWLEGKSNYGLRVAVVGVPTGVSLCTLLGNEIIIGQDRPTTASPCLS